MSQMSVKCTNCSEHVSPLFLPDHICGGNAGGMAGVGRRAFEHLMAGTPPLSPLSFEYGLRTPSPLSPRIATPTSPFLYPSPYRPKTPIIHPQSTTPTALSIPIPIPLPTRTPPPTVASPLSQVTTAPAPSTPKLPFLQKYKINTTVPRSPSQPPTPQTPKSPETPQTPFPSRYRYHDDEEDEIGLAYDKDVDEPQSSRTSISSHSVYSATTRLTRDFLSSPPPPPPPFPPPFPPTSPPTTGSMPMSPPRRSHTAPTTGPRGGTAGVPSPFGPSSPPPPLGTVRSISDAKLHHISRRPRDSDSSPTSLSSSPPTRTDEKSHSPASTTSPPGSAVKKPRVRICVKCDIRIENGRWIRMDGGKGILCEVCWKSMYLPKCRRCSKAIETAAVYSSDGQLKGKYHKQCFTCTVCDAPFSSNTFWIYQGQPMCEYHYHESNRSLCAARDCRKPIEGACAITDGDFKYHPACLVCSASECDERLEEYWEIEGRMMCERHAKEYGVPESPTNTTAPSAPIATRRSPSPQSQPALPIPRIFRPMDPSLRVQKRTTRLITLQTGIAF